jgi:hypothetical protein
LLRTGAKERRADRRRIATTNNRMELLPPSAPLEAL